MKKLVVLLLTLSLFAPGVCSSRQVEARTASENGGAASVITDVSPGNLPGITAAPVLAAPPLPESVDAETAITLGDPIVVNGPGVVVTDTIATIIASGTYRAIGTLTDGMIDVHTPETETETVELILDTVVITHTSGPAIMVTEAPTVSVVLADNTSNTLSDGEGNEEKGTLFSNDTLELSGNGALAITGIHKHGIVSDDDLTIDGGNITIAAQTDGMHANDAITVYSGTITVTEANDGLESEGTFAIEGGVFSLVVADDGLVSTTPFTITGGTIDVTAGGDGIQSDSRLVVDDGAITVAATDEGLSVAEDLTINGGQIYVNTDGDALESEGTLNLNGGVTVALGDSLQGGLACITCTVNGGILVATGGTNSTPASTSTQNVVVLGSKPVNTALHIERDDGDDTLTFLVSQAYQSMVFSSPALLPNRAYTVHTGGTIAGGTDFHGLYTGATYTGGSVWTTFTTNQVVTYVGGGPPPLQ